MDPSPKRLCHDLKTERPDVGRPLPAILRLLPISLYLSGAAALGFSALFLWQFKLDLEARDSWRTSEAATRSEQSHLAAETEAINFYWFDIHGLVLAPEYKNVEVSMLFGGKYAHNTWWTDEPRQIKGINLLPITTASTYLGLDPRYVKRNLDALGPEMETYKTYGKLPPNPPPRDIWQDVFAKYGA